MTYQTKKRKKSLKRKEVGVRSKELGESGGIILQRWRKPNA